MLMMKLLERNEYYLDLPLGKRKSFEVLKNDCEAVAQQLAWKSLL